MRIKINTTILYFRKKVQIKLNPMHSIFKWILVYHKCYILIELKFLKELMVIRQVNQKSPIFVIIGIFLNKGFKFQPNVCNGCHDLLMMSIKLTVVVILNIISADYLQKWGHKLNTKCRFDWKTWNITKDKKLIFIYKNG